MSLIFTAHLQVAVRFSSHGLWKRGDRLLGLVSSPESYPLWYVRSGCLRVKTAWGEHRIREGEFILMPGTPGRDVYAMEDTDFLSVGLHAKLFGLVDLLHTLKPPIVWTPPTEPRAALETLMREIEYERSGDVTWRPNDTTPYRYRGFTTPNGLPLELPYNHTTRYLRDSYGRAVFALCWRLLGGQDHLPMAADSPAWLGYALETMTKEPSLALPEIALRVGVSPVRLRRGFHRHLGTTPHDFLIQIRLETARRMLETSHDEVSAIATAVGFESQSYFTRLFKRVYGITPGESRHRGG
jgi:AraC-like DNA-binding protein